MSTGTIKWLDPSQSLGYVSIDSGEAEYGKRLRFVSFESIYESKNVLRDQPEKIAGEWIPFVSKSTNKGRPRYHITKSHLYTTLGLDKFKMTVDAVGLNSPISEYGVHVVAIHVGNGLVALVFVNLANSPAEIHKQQAEFLEKKTETIFKVETRYPYLSEENSGEENLMESGEALFWQEAGLVSLAQDARALCKSMQSTSDYVSQLCARIY